MPTPTQQTLSASIRVRVLPEHVQALAAAAAARGIRPGTLIRHWLCEALEQEQATDQGAA